MRPAVLVVASFLALALCITRPAHAQSDRGGRIEGTVTDSIHARPLAGARVVAAGVGFTSAVRRDATADPSGTFRIDSLPAGRYMVGFQSPLLDSLEIVLPPHEVTVPPGGGATVALALPSAAKLRAALCPGDTLPEGTGVVFGHVVSAETESPLADVAVALQWRELAFDRKKMRAVNSTRETSVITDDGGWYRACGVPTGAWVSMQVQDSSHVGPVLRTRVEDTLGITIRHLSFSSAASESGEVAGSVAVAPFTGTATLTGIVRGAGGLPVSSAEVHVRGARNVSATDAQGSFTLSGLPAGTHEFEVRHIGYAEEVASVDLRSGAITRSDVRMQRIANLDSVRVVATRTRYPEFAEHRKFGLGHYLGPEDIMRRHAVRTSDFVRSIGGYLVENSRGRTRVVSARGAYSSHPCVANVVIDGFSIKNDPDAFSVDDVMPLDVGAIELYRQGDFGPPEYDNGCGAIVIWTRR